MDKPPSVEHKRTPNHEDSTFATVLRFGLEVVAWLSIQQVWGWGVLVAVVLALAIFNARGDTTRRGITVPGAVRVLLEIGLLVAGMMALGIGWSGWASTLMLGGIVFYLAVAWRRYQRLLRQ